MNTETRYTRLNFIAFLLASFVAVALAVFISTTQSYFITDVLQIGDEVGSYVGTLGLFDEILSMCLVPFVGVFCDRVGSRIVVSAGFFICGVSLFGFAYFVTDNVIPQMLTWRLIFSVGLTSSLGIITIMVIELNHSGFNPVLFSSSRGSPSLDPDATSESVREAQREGSVERAQTTIEEVDILNKDRKDGKQVSLMGTMSGLGAVFSVMVLLRLPVFYGGSRTAKKAMELSYYSVGVLAFLTSVFMWFCAYKNSHDLCFKSKDPAQFHNERNNDALSEGIQSPDVDALGNSPKLESEESYLDSLKAGVRLSLEDPAILIAYLCGFLSRCITIIITLYIPFYVNRYFKDSGKCAKSFSEKIECPESYILSSILTGIANLFGLLLAPVSGILIDRLSNFTLLLMIAIGVSLTSFVSFCWVSQPDHSGLVYVSSALMGSAQILLIIISMTMLSNITSREKYKKRKGSISGVFAFVGGIGIIFTSYVGGLLADMNAKYPFILAAIANVVCGVIITISSRQNFRSIRLV